MDERTTPIDSMVRARPWSWPPAVKAGCWWRLERLADAAVSCPLPLAGRGRQRLRDRTRCYGRARGRVAVAGRLAAATSPHRPAAWRARAVFLLPCTAEPALGETMLDRLGAAAEQRRQVTGSTVKLERAVVVPGDTVAEVVGVSGQGLLVVDAGRLGVEIEGQAVERAPRAGGGQGGVDDECLAVQMRLGRARDLVPDDAASRHLVGWKYCFAGSAEAGDRRRCPQPGPAFPDGGVVWRQQPLVAADQGGEADTLRGREDQIPAWSVGALAAAAPAEPRLGVDPAVEQGPAGRARSAGPFRPCAQRRHRTRPRAGRASPP